ncbi:GTP 3',8-cyclase MoaA [Evansella tamaricis]|uniref:GTP 3',8-cyclase n=1 Tax=Evansella tamaricis TaxID=2069301 RepID=A0ABS6JG14_9BACI|nr:GTP 3',8-cyclase MoaA [Evansella tamaricis]MBU9712615.1 GTP 3',8-cyclase MoaA [Evansella tamaricis]
MNANSTLVTDKLSRPIKDLRISVTDQCNFRCSYCMTAELFGPDFPFLQQKELLSFDEITQIVEQFAKLGVEKLRITGGEPLLRKGLANLIRELNRIHGIKDIALTTNGVFLPKQLQKLKESGLKRINVSLDAIDDHVFRRMNGRNISTEPVLKGIKEAMDAGLPVKINAVIKKGVNDSQIIPMAKYFKDTPVILRFIEFMDVGNTNGWSYQSVVTKKEIISEINRFFPLEPVNKNYQSEVADRYRYLDGGGEIGVISSVSDSFCGNCTRARLSADGKLFTCLFAQKGHDLKKLLRNEKLSPKQLLMELQNIWGKRSDRYSEERGKNPISIADKIEMSYIGG